MPADQPLPEVALAVSAETVTPALVVVRPVGDIDTATVDQLRGAITAELTDGVRHLVLDLAGVDFLGSAGLALLVQQREAAIDRDGALRIASAPRAASRPLQLTGLAELFESYPDVDSAVADLR